MKKLLLSAVLVVMLVMSAVPVLAWDSSKQKDLGQDGNKMQWWLLDYGKNESGVPVAVTRKYYTNNTIKNETIELLMSKYGIAPEIAGSLYFTEYGYEYDETGKKFAVTYLRHYDMLGNEIHGTVYDGTTEATQKTFYGLAGIPAKVAPYALGRPVAAPKKAASSAPKKSGVPTRVVRAKDKR